MVPSGRRSLRRELKALLDDQARAAYDSGRQGRRKSEEVPKGTVSLKPLQIEHRGVGDCVPQVPVSESLT